MFTALPVRDFNNKAQSNRGVFRQTVVNKLRSIGGVLCHFSNELCPLLGSPSPLNVANSLKAAVTSVEVAVTEAQEEAVKVLGEDDDDDDDDSSHRPPPPPVVNDEELYDLETAVKKSRKASSTTTQVYICSIVLCYGMADVGANAVNMSTNAY